MTPSRCERKSSISSLVDAQILYRNGAVLGLVDEILIDTISGRVAYVIARDNGGQRTSIPWEQLEYERGNFKCRQNAP